MPEKRKPRLLQAVRGFFINLNQLQDDMNNSKPEDKFGDDLIIKAETSRQGADTAAKIIAICRGIRHILTPIAWVICTAIAYGAVRHIWKL